MLYLMRNFAKTWIAKILLAILIVSFGAWGISGVVTNLGSNVVAHVGDQDITSSEFQRTYQAQVNQAAQQLGKVPTSQEAMAMGIPQQVISRLASDAAVTSFAQKGGLGASDDRLSKILQEDPSFQGPSGKFDESQFVNALNQTGMTQAQYFADATKSALRQQVALGLFGDAVVPNAAQTLANRYANDTRTLNYFVLDPVSIPSIAKPTDADLAAYLKDHQAEFRTQETRTVDIMALSPEILAKGKKFTDAEIQAEYDRTKASRVRIEKRDIQQVTLTDDQAKAFTAGKAAGKTFDQLVADNKLKPTDLGTLTKAGISDSQLANAAFGLKQGDFVIIPGISGQRAITVTKIEPGGQISFADAKADVARSLGLAAAKKEYSNKLDEIENLRAANQPIPDVAKRYNLISSVVTLTNNGDALSAISAIPPNSRAKVTAAIFAAKKGSLTPSIALGGQENVWFDLTKIEPARDQTLNEVHDQVAKAWTTEKTNAALKAEADKLVGEIKAGKSFDDVAQSLNQFPVLSQPITRQGDRTAGDKSNVLNASVAAAAFNGGPKHFGYAIDGDGDYVIFQVEAITASSKKTPPQAKNAVENSVRDSLYGDFVTALSQKQGLKINQSAINQLLALGPNGN